VGELVGCSFAEYPNVRRWYRTVTADPAWRDVNQSFSGFVESMRGNTFVELS